MPEDVIFKFLDTLHTEKPKLSAAFAQWNRYDPNVLARDVEGLPFHEAAVKWLKSHGMWPPK